MPIQLYKETVYSSEFPRQSYSSVNRLQKPQSFITCTIVQPVGEMPYLRVLKRLGFTPPFVRRARYFRANLSEDCYAPSRVLQD